MAELTRLPVKMITARGRVGASLRNTGNSVGVSEVEDDQQVFLVSGQLDPLTGSLLLRNNDDTVVRIDGFFTANTIVQGNVGPKGLPGMNGMDGANGRDGEQGATGCQGPAGPRGDVGPQGSRGPQGIQGNPGPQGEQGIRGEDGFVQVYIQNVDPSSQEGSNIRAGALWVKP